jgi:hypothetical protein
MFLNKQIKGGIQLKIQVNGDQVILSKSELLQALGVENTPQVNPGITENKPKTLEVAITDYLTKLNFSRGIKGFEYIREAIKICYRNRQMCFMMMNLYSEVADIYGGTASSIERCIRHSIDKAYGRKLDKPCNSEFIALASDDIRLSFIK